MFKIPTSQFEITSMLTALFTPDLKAPEKLLLIVLSDFGDEKGDSIYPSLSTLAERSCMSRASVIVNLKKLIEKNYIAKITGGVINKQNVTNRYVINMEKLGFCYDHGRIVKNKSLNS